MNLREYLNAGAARIAREEFGTGDLRFTVEFALKKKSARYPARESLHDRDDLR